MPLNEISQYIIINCLICRTIIKMTPFLTVLYPQETTFDLGV